MTIVTILGGKSFVAPYLLQRLRAMGAGGTMISRRPCPAMDGFTSRQVDLLAPGTWAPAPGSTVISIVPLWTLAESLHQFTRCTRIIALGSTSGISKSNSASARDRAVAQRLRAAETALAVWSEETGVPYTLFRTTLIYDGTTDRNIARMAAFMRRFGFMPVATPANGLRQPIHADDVAAAICTALQTKDAAGHAYNIAGGEVLTHREMTERVAATLPRGVRIVPLPLWLLRATFKAVSTLGILHEPSFDAEIFTRMNEDLVFDTAPAQKTFGLAPRGFTPRLPAA